MKDFLEERHSIMIARSDLPCSMKWEIRYNPKFRVGVIRYENRVNNESGKYYEPVLDSINSSFKENWPNMTDEEKMR